MSNPIAYVELPAYNVAPLKKFYGDLFGWHFQDYGDNYASFSEAGIAGGFNADTSHNTRTPLLILDTKEIETMENKVRAAGGKISKPTFAFPGGRRFHFVDPAGNELAVMQLDE